MNKIIFLICYAVGVVVNYVYVKRSLELRFGKYALADYFIGIWFSMVSWIGVFVQFILNR